MAVLFFFSFLPSSIQIFTSPRISTAPFKSLILPRTHQPKKAAAAQIAQIPHAQWTADEAKLSYENQNGLDTPSNRAQGYVRFKDRPCAEGGVYPNAKFRAELIAWEQAGRRRSPPIPPEGEELTKEQRERLFRGLAVQFKICRALCVHCCIAFSYLSISVEQGGASSRYREAYRLFEKQRGTKTFADCYDAQVAWSQKGSCVPSSNTYQQWQIDDITSRLQSQEEVCATESECLLLKALTFSRCSLAQALKKKKKHIDAVLARVQKQLGEW